MERCARRRPARGPGVLAIVCLVSVSPAMSTGCSWLFVDRPPGLPIEPTPPVACTASVAAPVADTVGAVVFAAGGVVALVEGANTKTGFASPSGFQSAWLVGGLAGLAVAGTLVASAGSGYQTTAQCRDLKQAQAACLTGVEAACRSLRLDAAPPRPESPPEVRTPAPEFH